MKLSDSIRKSILWGRFIKLSMLAIPMICVTALDFDRREVPHFRLNRITIRRLSRRLSIFTNLFCSQFLNKDFLDSRTIVVNYEDNRAIGPSLDGFVAFAWVCEKMKINVKIKHSSSMIWRHFENDTLINNTDESMHKLQPSAQKEFFRYGIEWFGIFFISSAYGYKILSRLAINPDLERCANQWVANNIKGDYIAVHFRGTDASNRNRIDLDSYIIYLKEVIDNQYSIFVCSDQAQFIDKMRMAFPTRAFSRNIQRSYDGCPIHRHDSAGKNTGINSFNQEKDALIDLLVLAKAKLIYATGSAFVDVARYFNPQIKIISRRGQRRMIRGKNNLPMPRIDLYESLCNRLLK